MVINAWVLTLAPSPDSVASVVARLRERPGFELGALADGRRLPVVTETEDTAAARALLSELEQDAAIVHVDVVGVYFDDAQEA